MFVALGGGVGVVGLHVAGDAVDVFEEEGQEVQVIFFCERGVHGVEFFDVVGTVVGGEGDAGEGYLGSALLELLDHGGEVGLGLLQGEAAEAVVASELEDDELGVAGDDALDAVEAVLGGVAADAGVDDVVVVAAGVEELLEDIGVGLAGVGAEAGGEGVAEADDEVLRGRREALRGGLLRWGRGGRGGGRGSGCGCGVFCVTRNVFTASAGEADGERCDGDDADSG